MHRRSGFTLVELVMVIVILGILAAIAIPTFFNLQVQARSAACRGALGGLSSGISIWYARTAATEGTGRWPTLAELTQTTDGVMANGMIPRNPYTNTNTIIQGAIGATDTSVGWIYDGSGRIWDASGNADCVN